MKNPDQTRILLVEFYKVLRSSTYLIDCPRCNKRLRTATDQQDDLTDTAKKILVSVLRKKPWSWSQKK